MPGKDLQEAPALKAPEQKSKNQHRKRGQKGYCGTKKQYFEQIPWEYF